MVLIKFYDYFLCWQFCIFKFGKLLPKFGKLFSIVEKGCLHVEIDCQHFQGQRSPNISKHCVIIILDMRNHITKFYFFDLGALQIYYEIIFGYAKLASKISVKWAKNIKDPIWSCFD